MPPDTDAQVIQAPIGAVEGRPGVTVVTQENFNDYVSQQMGDPVSVNEDPEAAAAAEMAELEAKQAESKPAEQTGTDAPKEGDTDGATVYFNGKWVKKHDFNYRLHVKTQEAKAELQAKIDANAAEIKEAREASEKAQKEAAELRAKYEPPKTELGTEPDPADFTDAREYGKAMREWGADKARFDDAAAQQEAQAVKEKATVAKNWSDRQAATKAVLPDYDEKVNNSPVKVSDQMRDALLESEVGPKILYHFAEHPEVADALGKMTVRKMLVEFGKLEASLAAVDKPQTKTVTELKRPLAEISKAPAPISPIKGGVVLDGLKYDAAGNWTGTPEEWKAARLAGKIR